MAEELFPSTDYDIQAKNLERRRQLARSLIEQSLQGDAGQMVGRVYVPNNPWGNFAKGLAGGYMNSSADTEAKDLAAKQAQQNNELLSSIPQEVGPERTQAQLRAMQNPSLRDTIKAQMGVDEREAKRIEAGEQAAANRVEAERKAEADRIERGEQLAADRVARQDLRQTPTIHISQGGSGRSGVKAPSGYRYNEDGTALEPIPGGPADKKPGSKPLTAKQLETQRGFMDLDSSIANYEQLLGAYDFQGKTALDPAKRAALEGAYTDLQMKLKTLYELGAPQAGDLKLLSQSIPNPTDLSGTVKGAAFGAEPFKARLGETKKLLTSSRSNFEKQLGKDTPEPYKPPPEPKTVVREVKLKDGRTGVEYSDGTRGYK